MMRRYGAEKIGYIQFDSHADLHEIRTSPSGNFHGMWLRALLTGIGHARLDCLVREHLPSSAVRYYGNLDLEDAERVFIEKNNIDVWDSQRLQDMRSGSDNLANFIQRYTHVHVSFDIDVFDRALAPATGTPAPAGMQKDEIFPLLRTLARAPSLSVDLVEVNPQKKGAAETIALAQEVLRLLLGYETATIDPL
jgi:arginase